FTHRDVILKSAPEEYVVPTFDIEHRHTDLVVLLVVIDGFPISVPGGMRHPIAIVRRAMTGRIRRCRNRQMTVYVWPIEQARCLSDMAVDRNCTPRQREGIAQGTVRIEPVVVEVRRRYLWRHRDEILASPDCLRPLRVAYV